MKKVLYVLNDCMRKFTYERTTGLFSALSRLEEPVDLYIVRSDGYSAFAPEHNCGEYNIFRLPDYRAFDGIFLDINSVFNTKREPYAAEGLLNAVKAAVASGRPVVSMANDIDGCTCVGIDNYQAMRTVIRYLHEELGLTDFWFVMGPADNFENRERTESLLDYCAEHALPCGEDRFFAESFVMDCGIHGFESLYARHGGALPQTVICASDYIALGVCHAAERAGLELPRDLMVTGFDNDDVSAYLSPSITSVDQKALSLGDFCVDVMCRIWRGEDVPRRVITPTELILRESTRHPDTHSNMRKRIREYIDETFSAKEFSYRLSAFEYQLPGCKSLEEIGAALVSCLSGLGCRGLALVLDSELLEGRTMLQFDGHIGQLRDVTDGMPTQGYSDNMELVYLWEAGEAGRLVRQKLGRSLTLLRQTDARRSYLFAPLHFMEYTVGYLGISDCLDLLRIKGVSSIVNTLTMALRNFFSRRDLSIMSHLLAGISMKDELTGLYNRLGYHNLAYPLFRELKREGGRLGVLFIDMDRLKLINDSLGHAAGDRAIRSLANAIARSVPADAIPVRYGGDEFLVLVPAAGEAEVRALFEAVLAALPGEAEALGAPPLLDISVGCLAAELSEGGTLDEYVQRADALMYREKKNKKRQRAE